MKKPQFILSLALLALCGSSQLPATAMTSPAITQKIIDNGGSGPFKAEAVSEATLPGFVVYKPEDMVAACQHQGPLPLVIFANGGCNDTSLPFERMLNDLASHGYLVIALGEMQERLDDRDLQKSPNEDMLKAIDWATTVNADSRSEYWRRIDLDTIALTGMSCGGAQVMANCADPRVKTYIMFNSGMGDMEMSGASAASLRSLHAPVLYILGGEGDVAYSNALKDYERISHVPVVFATHPTAGHGGTYHEEYGGSFSKLARMWLAWQFKDTPNYLDVFLRGRLTEFPDFTVKAKNFDYTAESEHTYEAPADPAKRPQRPRWEFDAACPDVHDPVLAEENGKYYMFTTGMGVGMMSSADGMKTWKLEKAPLDPIPTWAQELVPAYKGHTWAPDIRRVGDKWHLYYSCSTFGKNISVIGMATNKTLDPASPDYKWEDQGMVVQSIPGQTDWNAIDPNLIIDREGQAWLNWGSFWDGIQLVQLGEDLRTPVSQPQTIARRRRPETVAHLNEHANLNAIEAPFIVERDGWYYLFCSWDYCCKGLSSNYKTVVGRSRTITGPYVDREGRQMLQGGGTLVAGADSQYCGVGHCGVYELDGKWYIVAHAYDRAKNGASKLYLRELRWVEGWPMIAE